MKSLSQSVGCLGISVLALLSACDDDPFTRDNTPSAGTAGASGNSTAGSAGEPAGGTNGGSAGSAQGGAGIGGAAGSNGGAAGVAGTAGTAGTGGKPMCEIGTFMCQDEVLSGCNLSTRVFEPIETCGVGLCNAEKGRCDECAPNSVLGCVNDTTQKICNSSGTGEKVAACPSSKPFCVGGGDCVECRDDSDCSESQIDCFRTVCLQGACTKKTSAKGSLAKSQVDADCHKNLCDGNGNVVSAVEVADKPSPSSDCFQSACSETGEPKQTPLKAGTGCGDGGICNGSGMCGVCLPGSVDCSSLDSTRTCNKDGQWGDASPCPTQTPACDGGQCIGITKLAAGAQHTCALMSNKTVWCWGSNLLSQLGIGQGADAYKSNPTEVKIDNVIDIDLADNYSCALKSTGKIFCWGANDQGSLGTGKLSGFVYEPEEVISPNVFISISANGEHTCAIDDKKKIYCWGFNENFSCGLDGNTNKIVSSPQLISSISGVKKVVSGLEHTCALTETGSVFCWGTGTQGQLGTGVKEGSNHIPNLVKLLPTSFDIISGYDQLLAFVKDDTSPIKKDPWIWGAGESGQNFSWKTPEACQLSCDLYAPTRVKPGDSTSLFETPILGYKTFSIILGGLVANFGYNIDGRLGVGKKFNLSESYGGPIESLTSIVEIAPGDGHMCARQSTGKIFCWGQGSKGQLGNGDTAEQLNPVEVKWLAANHSTLSSWKPFSPDGQSTEVLCHLVKPASK